MPIIIPQPFPWGTFHENIDFFKEDHVVKTSYALPGGGVVVARQAQRAGPIEVSYHKNKTKQTVQIPTDITILEGVHPSGLALVCSCAGTLYRSQITLEPKLSVSGPKPLRSSVIANWSWLRLGGVSFTLFSGDWSGQDAWGNTWTWVTNDGLSTDFQGRIEIQSQIRI